MKLPIYMDNHATTPMDPRVFEAMMPYFTETFRQRRQPQSQLRLGSRGGGGESRASRSRSLIGATAKEIVFTSGATESNNLALKGVAEMYAEKGNHIITAATEHKAVLDTCKRLEKHGVRVTYLPVQTERPGRSGAVAGRDHRQDDPGQHHVRQQRNRRDAADRGDRQDREARRRAVAHRRDAGGRQSAGQCDQGQHRPDVAQRPQDVRAEGRGRAVCSAQEPARAAHGADGRRRPRARHAFGHAECSGNRRVGRSVRALPRPRCRKNPSAWRICATSCSDKLQAELDEVYINGTMEHRLPNNLNISFAYVEGESLLMGINDIAVSSGSACTSATLEPSYVLKALGAGDDLAHSSIRFGLGRFNTEEEVDYVAAKVIDVVKKLRELSPLYEMAKEGIDLIEGPVGCALSGRRIRRGHQHGLFR